MKIDTTNINRIHELLITDIQRRLFKQYNARKDEFNITDEDYDTQNTVLYSDVSKCNTLNDVNDLGGRHQNFRGTLLVFFFLGNFQQFLKFRRPFLFCKNIFYIYL